MAKALLAIMDEPIIQCFVEAMVAGIMDIVFVTGRTKRAIKDHFDATPELEREFREKGKASRASVIHEIMLEHVNCIFMRKPLARGRAA